MTYSQCLEVAESALVWLLITLGCGCGGLAAGAIWSACHEAIHFVQAKRNRIEVRSISLGRHSFRWGIRFDVAGPSLARGFDRSFVDMNYENFHDWRQVASVALAPSLVMIGIMTGLWLVLHGHLSLIIGTTTLDAAQAFCVLAALESVNLWTVLPFTKQNDGRMVLAAWRAQRRGESIPEALKKVAGAV